MSKNNLIILVEDSKTQAALTKHALVAQGYDVVLFENGKLALPEIKKQNPLIVISDIVMPEMDGFELCERIKNDPAISQIPVILLTSLDSPIDVKRGLLSGADNYLTKPVNPNSLKDHIYNSTQNYSATGNEYIKSISKDKIINFLITTYETAIIRSKELEQTKKELSILNLFLENKVKDRTDELEHHLRELNCLLDINDLYVNAKYDIKRQLIKTAEIIKSYSNKPDELEIALKLQENEYQTMNFSLNDPFIFESKIKSGKNKIGYIKVSSKKDLSDFKIHGIEFLKAIARRLYELFELDVKEIEIINQNNQLKEKIKEIKEINLELEKSRKKAIEGDQLKSAFLANMSHEIRTPLNSILGFSDLINDDDVDSEERNSYCNIIRNSSLQLMNIVNEILDISKIETGQVNINLEEINLAKEINAIVDIFEFEATSKNLRLIVNEIDPSIQLVTDRNIFQKIMNNLIANAIKFTLDGSIEIGIKALDDKNLFYVKDTGIGIPEEHHERIFKRFAQIEEHTKRNFGGTGLGLAITKNLVELLNGKIWYESEVNKGTTFYFELGQVKTEAIES